MQINAYNIGNIEQAGQDQEVNNGSIQPAMLFPEIMQIMIKMEIGTGDREKLQIPFRREKMRWHI